MGDGHHAHPAGNLYLASVPDVRRNRIVGWVMTNQLRARLKLDGGVPPSGVRAEAAGTG